ncbi:MAG: MATE family efflux transporter [Candidatus Zixiibacteriota bacterium]|nr:MAG: MATE family efflux transporter [candidate division Zixibacteria bacterium]
MEDTTRQGRADYTEGPIIGSILKMGLPSMFGFLSNNIYHLVDTWWVSRLPQGEMAVAALTFFNPILMVLFSFNMLIGPGSVAVISRRYGEKDYPRTEKAIKETLLLKLLCGFIFGLIGFVFIRDLMSWVGAAGEVLAMGVPYGQIWLLGLAVPYATYSIFTGMRGVANPNMAMFLMIGSNLFNLGLDPLLIFGYFGFPAWGIAGAAAASMISYTLTLTVGLILFYRGSTNVRLHFKGKAPISVASSLKIVRIGVPAWLASISWSSSRVLIISLIENFGTSVVAAYGVGIQIVSFGIMVVVGIGLGLSSLIGHNLGAEKIKRARQTGNQAILLGVGIMIVLGLFVFIFAGWIMGKFFEAPETIAHGVAILQIFAISFPAFGLFFMIEEIHMGVGLNTPMMIFEVILNWVLQVLPIWIAVTWLGWSPTAVWWIITGSLVVTSIAVYAYYRRGRWLTVKV